MGKRRFGDVGASKPAVQAHPTASFASKGRLGLSDALSGLAIRIMALMHMRGNLVRIQLLLGPAHNISGVAPLI